MAHAGDTQKPQLKCNQTNFLYQVSNARTLPTVVTEERGNRRGNESKRKLTSQYEKCFLGTYIFFPRASRLLCSPLLSEAEPCQILQALKRLQTQ